MHASARQHQRVDEHYQTDGRLETRVPTVEYVNRQGDRVSPTTGRPVNKPPDSSTNGANGVHKRTRGPRRRRRKTVISEGSMFGNLEAIPRDATCDPPPRACFNCWQQGHTQQECPRPSNTGYCNNCGRRGEDVRSCPRCSRAHREYLSQQQNRERGEDVELEEVLGGSLVHEQEDANDDACDEVLRELIYRDDRERELGRSSYSRDAYKPGPSMHDQRQRDQSSYRDREDEEYIRRDYNAYNNYYSKQQDDKGRDSRSTSRQRDREYEDDHLLHGREYRSENYKESKDREDYYRREERDRDYNARASRSESRKDELESKHKLNYFDNVDLNADPVQEVLQLAKSIAHLTPETQDLIMRQVMAERKERVRLRAMKLQEPHTDAWP